MKPRHRKDAEKWLRTVYAKSFQGRVAKPGESSGRNRASSAVRSDGADSSNPPHVKRRRVSSANIFSDRMQLQQNDDDDSDTEAVRKSPYEDEIGEYLKLPQIENTNEWCCLEWWATHAHLYPNLALMARQYHGCPATSATVERLFSVVGYAFSKCRRNADADTLRDLAFTKLNVEVCTV